MALNPLFEDVLKNWRLSNDVYKLSTKAESVATPTVGADAEKETLLLSDLTHAAKAVNREIDLLEIHKRRPRKYLEKALERYQKLKDGQCISN